MVQPAYSFIFLTGGPWSELDVTLRVAGVFAMLEEIWEGRRIKKRWGLKLQLT